MYNEKVGMDLSWLYDPDNIFDAKKKQEQEEWLDNSSLEEIANVIDDAKERNLLNATTFRLLYAADFADRLENQIIPALKS